MDRIEYTYDVEQKVFSVIEEFYSSKRIGKNISFSSDFGRFVADFVVYNSAGEIKLIIETKSSNGVNKTLHHRLSKYLNSLKEDIIFAITDGEQVIYSSIGKESKVAIFREFLESTNKNEKIKRPTIVQFRKILTDALCKIKAEKSSPVYQKIKILKAFTKELRASDLHVDKKDNTIWYLNVDKERKFFSILLGEYSGNYLVKFTSARSLHALIEKEAIGMCSIVCMNDPHEKDYADQYIYAGDDNRSEYDNSADTFIISACNENSEANLTMYRLYGDDAKGVCLKFWIDKTKINQNGFYLAPVSYSSDDKTHLELEIIKHILLDSSENNWKIEFAEWNVWKHFFKKHSYAIENEIRLIYMPSEFIPLAETLWFTDDRTKIYSEMKIFDLTHDTAFPLVLDRIILGPKFPTITENISQFNRRFLKSTIIRKPNNEELVSYCKIGNYR